MVYMWFVSSFSKPDRRLIVDTDIGQCSVDDVAEDINALILMGLEHDASEASVIFHDDNSSNIVSVSFDFSNDNSWEEFCRAFLKENSSNNDDNAESANEEN